MSRLLLVRHGEASAGFGSDRDPGLSVEGHAQADAVAEQLAERGPLALVTSPLRRCRETAAPLAARWSTDAIVEAGIAEVAAPSDDLDERARWLRGALAGSWADLEPGPRRWRNDTLETVRSLGRAHPDGAVLVTHFIVVNAVIGEAVSDDRVMVRRLDNGSITELDVDDDGSLRLVTGGETGESRVW